MPDDRVSSRVPESRRDAERARIRAAIIGLVGARGYREVTEEMVADRAGVDLAGFRRHFTDLEDCFGQVYAEFVEEFMDRMAAAFSSEQAWRDRLRALGYDLAHYLAEDHDRARFVVLEAPFVGERTQAVREELFEWLFGLVDQGRQELEDPESLTPATAAAVGGAIFSRMRAEVLAGSFDTFEERVPNLMYSAVLPYLGREAALEELSIRPPERRPLP
jgi:AcrR family transcriptional regulator